MTFQEFLNKYNGQVNVGNTTENMGECVGLVSVWIESLGLPHIWGHAKDLFANADEVFFTKIINTPEAIPQAGDIIVWGSTFGTYGHTGIATGTADLNSFECFQQNDPLGSNCHLKTYTYTSVIGWLRPITAQNTSSLIEEIRADRDKNWNLYQTQLNHTIELEDVVAHKQQTIDNLTKENITYKEAIDTITKEKQAVLDEYTALKVEASNAKNELQTCETKLDVANGLLANRKDIYKWSWIERFTSLFGKG